MPWGKVSSRAYSERSIILTSYAVNKKTLVKEVFGDEAGP